MRVNILSGVRVIDLTMWAFVPSAEGVLAHGGADVIKVESPRSPDPMRLLGGTLEPGDASWFFKNYSRGKRALALDLASNEGREILYKLVDGADVFLPAIWPRPVKSSGSTSTRSKREIPGSSMPRDRSGAAGSWIGAGRL